MRLIFYPPTLPCSQRRSASPRWRPRRTGTRWTWKPSASSPRSSLLPSRASSTLLKNCPCSQRWVPTSTTSPLNSACDWTRVADRWVRCKVQRAELRAQANRCYQRSGLLEVLLLRLCGQIWVFLKNHERESAQEALTLMEKCHVWFKKRSTHLKQLTRNDWLIQTAEKLCWLVPAFPTYSDSTISLLFG